MERVRVGIIGLGQRGSGMLRTFIPLSDVDVVAVCDVYQDRVDSAIKTLMEKGKVAPKGYTDFNELLKNKSVLDCVYIATSWEAHIDQTIACLKEGIPVGMEVGGAYNLKDCWRLVKAYEKYKTPVMLMENCCYDKFELLSTSMARKGLLGEIVHCHGAYSHDLRDEILGGKVNRHYRLRNYISRNCENYPTHELGPIAKLIGINRGNKMVSMVSVASKSRGLQEFAKSDKNPDKSLVNQEFKQGDVVSTIITCENGETITMTLDTTLPKYYSREFTVRGTKGAMFQEPNMAFVGLDSHEFWGAHKVIKKYLNNADEFSQYLPDYWRNITPEEIELGHGGMDFYMVKEFIKAVKEGLPMPIDVYDAAAWYSITPISAKSIKHNGKPYKIPDFTRGKYKNRPLEDVVKL